MALNSKQQMKPYHKNPRRINKKQFEQLKENLLYLGDLSGIVHDLNSNEIIGGNQRSSVFDVNECDVEIVHQYDYPDEQGTIAHGFIIWKDKRYTYRQVRWTPKQCEQANITANRLGGEWDFDELANWDMSELLTWGFEEGDFPFDVAPAMDEGENAGIDSISSQFAIMITCDSEEQQSALLERFNSEGIDCKALIS